MADFNDNNVDVYSPEMLKELDKHSKAVHAGLGKINVDIEKVAFNLYWIYENKAYKAMGHETIMDYARDEFDFSKSTTYNFINIVERFGSRDKNGKLLSDKFDRSYSGYSYSKLVLLADLEDSEIENLGISSDMSVRDIKKSIKDGLHVLRSFKTPISEPISDDVKVEPESDSQQSIDFKDNEAFVSDVQELNSECVNNNYVLYHGDITLRDFIDGLTPELLSRYEGSINLFFMSHPDLDPEKVLLEITFIF